MSNYELIKNAEGYADPTAADTLNRKEPGDVWTYNSTECLIIKNHGSLSTILTLFDYEKHPNNVEFMTSLGPRYTDPRLVTYGLHQRMVKYVGSVDAEVFNAVIGAVGNALGASLPCKEIPQTADTQEVEKLQAEVEQLQDRLRGLETRYDLRLAELRAADARATKATNQLDLLRDMYGDLLTKMMGATTNAD